MEALSRVAGIVEGISYEKGDLIEGQRCYAIHATLDRSEALQVAREASHATGSAMRPLYTTGAFKRLAVSTNFDTIDEANAA